MQELTHQQVQHELNSLPGWGIDNDKLHRKLKFENFIDAFSFMTRIALLAEKVDHHPEWLNVYDTLEIWLTSHEAGGISTKDIDLARKINDMTTRSS